MKKICTLLATVFIGGLLHAQVDKSEEIPPFRFGIHFTPNISYIGTDDPSVDAGANVKYGFGLLAEYLFAPNYGISTGLNIQRRGGKLTGQDTAGNALTANYTQPYIQIPVKLKMRTREFGYITGFAEFGGSLDVALEEDVSFEPDIPNPGTKFIAPVNAMFKIGIGGEYSFGGRSAALVALHWNYSLFDNLASKDHPIPLDNDTFDYRLHYVSLRLGFLF